MKKLVLKEKRKYSYILDDNGNEVEMILEFHVLNLELQIGDVIYFPKKLVRNNQFYSFGMIGEKYSKQDNVDLKEIIKIVTRDVEIYLQRFYG